MLTQVYEDYEADPGMKVEACFDKLGSKNLYLFGNLLLHDQNASAVGKT